LRFLADIGISPRVVESLRRQGYDAMHLHEQSLYGLTDAKVLDKARAEGRIVLTSDLDFGELLALSRAGLPSVIVFRLKDMRPENVQRYLTHVLASLATALDRGAIVSATERRCHLHHLPIERAGGFGSTAQ